MSSYASQVIGIAQLAQALEPAINELLTNESWRVRLATIELLPLVSKQLGIECVMAHLSVVARVCVVVVVYVVVVTMSGVEGGRSSVLKAMLKQCWC